MGSPLYLDNPGKFLYGTPHVQIPLLAPTEQKQSKGQVLWQRKLKTKNQNITTSSQHISLLQLQLKHADALVRIRYLY